jgi:hypothetical protein
MGSHGRSAHRAQDADALTDAFGLTKGVSNSCFASDGERDAGHADAAGVSFACADEYENAASLADAIHFAANASEHAGDADARAGGEPFGSKCD